MYRNKSAKDVSLIFTILYTTGLAFTLAYMIMLQAVAGIITVSFETLVAIVVLVLKIMYDQRQNLDCSRDEKEKSVTALSGN